MRPAFSLGDMLRQLRAERGLSQTQLARRLGLEGNAVVSRLERGHALPSTRLRARLARVLGVEPALLESRARRESHGSTASALLSDLQAGFERVQAQLDAELQALHADVGRHQERLSHVLRLSELQLLWGLADKLAYEATVSSAWVVTPDLLLDVQNVDLRQVVAANLQRGVAYRYLVPSNPGVIRRARSFRASFRRSVALEVRHVPNEGLLFLSEFVLYDASSARRLGLMVAPTARSDVDCVLSPTHAARLARAFHDAWKLSRPVETNE